MVGYKVCNCNQTKKEQSNVMLIMINKSTTYIESDKDDH